MDVPCGKSKVTVKVPKKMKKSQLNKLKKALKKAEKDGTITSKNKWQMIEYWAADYLAGK